MRYAVEHQTSYAYATPVAQSWQIARLTPRALPWQQVIAHTLTIDPPPHERSDSIDGFGNHVERFALHGAHRRLRVGMRCLVDVIDRPQPDAGADLPWEAVRVAPRDLLAARLAEASPKVGLSVAARAYAAPHFAPGRGWLQAVAGLMGAIHRDFDYDPQATTVSTEVDALLELRRGVCQDFAHLMLAGLRAHGLAARYVSGYLLTDSAPGQPRLLGVDASHAWVAAYAPRHGWVEFDPTNNQCADARYITLAWGADFADVAPLRGVILGGGEQTMEVAVSVTPA